MEKKYKVGLVLEGGGMRGVYTAGVLDCFIDYHIDFPYIIGTSAGATTGASYASAQKGRTRYCDIDLLRLRNYIGLKPMIGGHGVIDMDFLFDTFPNDIYPFDFQTYQRSGKRLVMVASNAQTGKAEYLEEYQDVDRFTDIARASCSLPIMCPMGQVDNIPMVDGGVTDSIPFERALADGCEKLLVVLTKEDDYRKKPGAINIPSVIYRKYPLLREVLGNRNDAYNAQLDSLKDIENKGIAMVMRPTESCGVGRTTDDTESLDRLYDLGYKMAHENLDRIRQFLGEGSK
ncbi:MAG: patatin family protein [Bacteroidales bacterium]|nr:patatin family protein [Bacteroidales bacterium]